MPHALTDRQREYLTFIRQYVQRDEVSPRLEEITNHFNVSAPTAHKILQALMDKGYLYFERSSAAGYYIRLIERAGAAEVVLEVPLVGKVDRYGELVDFPEHLGNFPAILQGVNPDEVFSLVLSEDIPQAGMQTNDFVIFDIRKQPQPGDICIGPIGERFFFFRIPSKTFDKNTPSLLNAMDYPIPEALSHPEHEQELHYYPLAFDSNTEEFFLDIVEEQGSVARPLPPGWLVGTALRLIRALHFKNNPKEQTQG